MKATKAEVQQRVEQVLRLRVDGAEFQGIAQYAAANQWNVGERQLWEYISRSDDLMAGALEKDRPKLLARHLRQRRMLFAKCVEMGDYKGALAALKDEAELLDLYPAEKHQHSGPDGGPIPHDHSHALTDDDRDAIRQRLLARLGYRPGTPVDDAHGNVN